MFWLGKLLGSPRGSQTYKWSMNSGNAMPRWCNAEVVPTLPLLAPRRAGAPNTVSLELPSKNFFLRLCKKKLHASELARVPALARPWRTSAGGAGARKQASLAKLPLRHCNQKPREQRKTHKGAQKARQAVSQKQKMPRRTTDENTCAVESLASDLPSPTLLPWRAGQACKAGGVRLAVSLTRGERHK